MLPDDPSTGASGDSAASVPQRYLALLAEAAERLLAAGDPAVMVDELFVLIRRELRLDVFFNYRLEDDRLVLAAHGGLTEQQARDGAVLDLGQAVCGCVARDRAPRHVVAVQASADPLHAFVRDMGVNAYVCTPLMHGDRLLGTLGFGRRWTDRFSPEELTFIRAICHDVALAKHRLGIEEALRHGVELRERLLAELNHRVRNALQVAVGLVAMELGQADAAARPALSRAVDRLQVLALAHRPLYAGDAPDAIDLSRLLTALIEDGRAGATIGTLAPMPCLPVESAAALALLIHALLAGAGDAAVTLSSEAALPADGAIRLRLSGIDRAEPMDRMTRALIHQLRACITVDDHSLLLMIPHPAP